MTPETPALGGNGSTPEYLNVRETAAIPLRGSVIDMTGALRKAAAQSGQHALYCHFRLNFTAIRTGTLPKARKHFVQTPTCSTL